MGQVVVPGVVPTLSETPGRITNLGPPLGNATYEVMRELLELTAARDRRAAQAQDRLTAGRAEGGRPMTEPTQRRCRSPASA